VRCIRDDQLYDYIVEKDYGKRLKQEDVERLAQAFLGLAHMDTGSLIARLRERHLQQVDVPCVDQCDNMI
jgi:hypothetical protein